ncbi:MAG TPA: N-acetylneuraminate synthase family protein [Phycisphaerales bacterium]|nr:N-acetylneuraminate synthase family protein [Phycisphaerales bacterium]
MKIGSRTIGLGAPPYIIAEIGVNHDGSVERALQLVDAAADAGADAVKLQLFKAELLMSRASRLAGYQADAGETDPLAMLRRLELPDEGFAAVSARSKQRGIHAIVTVFSVELIARAEQVGWDAYKTASPDIIHRPLLDALQSTGRPLIISTGAASLDEVTRAAGWLAGAHGAQRLAVLQCVSSYPTPRERAALGGIAALQRVFDGPVGYSDHTADRFTGASAVAMGACVLEKHLTYDTKAQGPDHAASLDPSEFTVYAAAARSNWTPAEGHIAYDVFQAELRAATDRRSLAIDHPIGKSVLPIEQDVRSVSRQSIVTARAISAGETITRDGVTFKRPGAGIEPFRLAEVVGRRAARALAADSPIAAEDLA